ncbi:hypothetical protein [Frankia sp. Cj3]|uniref:hypothetical protein n=1 Tax=Frankia sp. Cj3 TaxID=2880976 RepID=UPI001EF4B0A2|nr:hypothetical protein [Frankia sp. Cj3]
MTTCGTCGHSVDVDGEYISDGDGVVHVGCVAHQLGRLEATLGSVGDRVSAALTYLGAGQPTMATRILEDARDEINAARRRP